MRAVVFCGAMVAASLAVTGCASKKASKPAPLQPQAFYAPPAKETPAGEDGGGGAARIEKETPRPAEETVASAAPAATTAPVSRPAVSISEGSFMLVGVVVGEANAVPVYADRVLTKIEPEMAAKAKQLGPQEFRVYAKTLLNQAVDAEIQEELEFAAAQRNTSDEDQQMAAGMTSAWRQREINKFGGSLAVTRRRYKEIDNSDFDEKVREQFRRNLVILYYQKHVWPRVQLTADDMRRYYERNLAEMFTEKAAIRFRVIRVGAKETGGRDKALLKAQDIQRKARGGEDFASLAVAFNDNKTWARNKGFMDMVEEKSPEGETTKVPAWFQKGSLKLEELEKALFASNVGEVTELIDGGEAFYVARLEQKQTGRVREFEDEEVQARIEQTLRSEQRRQLRQKERLKLMKASVARKDDKMMELAVDMAMQKYAVWTRK